MKKLILLILVLFTLVGCSDQVTSSSVVEVRDYNGSIFYMDYGIYNQWYNRYGYDYIIQHHRAYPSYRYYHQRPTRVYSRPYRPSSSYRSRPYTREQMRSVPSHRPNNNQPYRQFNRGGRHN